MKTFYLISEHTLFLHTFINQKPKLRNYM